MKKPEKLFNLDTIKNAVDIAIGDDGLRSKEVIEILEQVYEEDYKKFDGMSGDTENVKHVNLFEEEMKQYEEEGLLQIVKVPPIPLEREDTIKFKDVSPHDPGDENDAEVYRQGGEDYGETRNAQNFSDEEE